VTVIFCSSIKGVSKARVAKKARKKDQRIMPQKLNTFNVTKS
jgi:CRISPR/Cas system CMR subunit Cmr4 (Cas7 group RAMP superfamily)